MATAPDPIAGPPPQIRMSDIRAKFPMYQDLSDEQLLSGLRKKFYADVPISDFYSRIDMDTERARLQQEAAESGSWLDRARANIGAGFDSTFQGARQLASKVGFGSGPTDDEIREKRSRDQALARGTTGGGALQVVGEVAPTLVLPGAAATNAGRLGLGALGGGIGGALQPVTSDESRLKNTTIGALAGGALGVALPAAISALGGTIRRIRGAVAPQSEARAVLREAVTEGTNSGAEAVAARNAAATELEQAAQAAAQRAPGSNFPLTVAMQTQNPALARAERGLRARSPEAFAEIDDQRARAIADAVMSGTQEATQGDAIRAARRANWDTNWQDALANVDADVFAQRMGGLNAALEQGLRSPESVTAGVTPLLTEIQNTIARYGDDFGPAHLQQIRANLNARGSMQPRNVYEAAPRESRQVDSIIRELDDILNETTGGRFTPVNAGYAADSRLLDASNAAGKVRSYFVDDTGRIRGTGTGTSGEVMNVTEAGLGRALDQARVKGQTQLSQGAQEQLGQALEALRRQNILQRVAKTASGGGGSNTAGDFFAALAQDAPGSGLLGAGTRLWNATAAPRDAALARLLNDPELAAAALRTNPSRVSNPQLRMLIEALQNAGAQASQDLATRTPGAALTE